MVEFSLFGVIASIAVGTFGLILLRLSTCLPQYRRRSSRSRRVKKNETLSVLLFFGSGGHTSEMLRFVSTLEKKKFQPFHFVLSHSDVTSEDRIKTAHLSFEDGATWHRIHRSREVKQSWITTVFSTLWSGSDAVWLVWRIRPDVLICNGPGTCVPLCYAAFLLRFLGLHNCTIIFVESFCRVTSLSLSGKMVYLIVDKFIVQWQQLCDKYPRAEHLGTIC